MIMDLNMHTHNVYMHLYEGSVEIMYYSTYTETQRLTRSFLLILALKAYYVPFVGVLQQRHWTTIVNVLLYLCLEASMSNIFCLPKHWQLQLLQALMETTARQQSAHLCSIAKGGVQTGDLGYLWLQHGLAVEVRHRKGQVTKGADGEMGAIGRAVVSDEQSDNRNSNIDKLCSNCNNTSW